MTRLLKIVTKWPLFIGLMALTLVLATFVWFSLLYAGMPRLTLDFNRAEPAAELLQLDNNGFFKPERNNEFGGYRWTKPEFSLTFTYLARRDYKLKLWAGAPLAEPVTVKANAVEVSRFTPIANIPPQLYEITIPANLIQDGAVSLQFKASPFEPKNDRRGQLGLVITRLELERQAGNLLLPPRVLLQALAVAALFWLLGLYGLGLAALAPGTIRRGWFWVVGILIVAAQWIWLATQFAAQPLGLDSSINNLLYNLERLLLAEYAVVLCVWLSHFFLKWFSAKQVPGETQSPVDSNAASNKVEGKGIDALTSLRFFAALLVMGYHLPLEPDLPLGIYGFLRQGYVGVSLFYVLSGFILCYNYFSPFQNKLDGDNLKKFWLARFARIYPMYLLTFLVAFLLNALAQQVEPGLALVHALALQSYLPGKEQAINFNGPAWSVSVEIFFYLLFPFLLFWGVRYLKTARQILLVGLVIWLAQLGLETLFSQADLNTQEYLFYRFGPGRLSEFVIGVLVGRLFLLWQARPIKPLNLRLIGGLVLAGVVGVIAIMFLDKNVWRVYRYGTIYAPAFGLLIYFLARYRTGLSRMLSLPALVLLGEASYSFYLLHDLVIRLMTNEETFTPSGLAAYFFFGAILLVTTLASLIAFHWYETPVRRWLRAHLTKRPSQALTPEPVNLNK